MLQDSVFVCCADAGISVPFPVGKDRRILTVSISFSWAGVSELKPPYGAPRHATGRTIVTIQAVGSFSLAEMSGTDTRLCEQLFRKPPRLFLFGLNLIRQLPSSRKLE